MADETASLIIRVDSQGASTATRELDKLDGAGRRAERATDGLRKSFAGLRGVVAGLGAGLAFREIVRSADTFQSLNAQIALVTDSLEEQEKIYNDLFSVSQRTRADLESSVNLYTRLARSVEGLNVQDAQLLQLTELINQSFAISGASAQEASAAITQLAQGFASGALRGDEFNSVNEQAPRLMEALAKGLGVTRGELRKLAAEGKLTTEVMLRALSGQADAIAAEFGKLPRTVGAAMQQLRNDITNALGRTDTQPIVDAIDDIRQLVSDPEFVRSISILAAAIINVGGAAASATAYLVEFVQGAAESAARLSVGETEIMALDRSIQQLQATINSGVIGDGKLLTGIRLATGEFIHQGESVDTLKDKLEELQKQRDSFYGTSTPQEAVEGSPVAPTASSQSEIDLGADFRDVLREINEELDKNREIVGRRVAAIEEEAATLGMSARQAELYRLAQAGANEAELAAADAALRKAAAFEEAAEREREAAGAAELRREEYQALVESLRSEEEALIKSYQLRRDIILENTEANSEARKNLLERLNRNFSDEVLGGFGSAASDFDSQEKQILDDFKRRRALILENTQITEEMRTELELELTRRRNEQLDELDAERRQTINDGYITLLDVMKQFYSGMEGEEAAYARAAIAIGQTLLDERKRDALTGIIANTQEAAMGAYSAMASIPYIGPFLGAAAAGTIYAAGGLAAAKVSGLYDSGGFIPAGKVGIVGEYGPEFVSGPANVTSRKETADMARQAVSGGGRNVTVNQTINVSGRPDNRTATQMARESQRKQQMTQRRIG